MLWQQGIDVAIQQGGGQPGEHLGEPGMRFVAVGFGGRQQAHDRRRAAAGRFGSGEQSVLAAQGDRPDRILDRAVVDRMRAVLHVAGQRIPATQRVVHRLGRATVGGHPRASIHVRYLDTSRMSSNEVSLSFQKNFFVRVDSNRPAAAL